MERRKGGKEAGEAEDFSPPAVPEWKDACSAELILGRLSGPFSPTSMASIPPYSMPRYYMQKSRPNSNSIIIDSNRAVSDDEEKKANG